MISRKWQRPINIQHFRYVFFPQEPFWLYSKSGYRTTKLQEAADRTSLRICHVMTHESIHAEPPRKTIRTSSENRYSKSGYRTADRTSLRINLPCHDSWEHAEPPRKKIRTSSENRMDFGVSRGQHPAKGLKLLDFVVPDSTRSLMKHQMKALGGAEMVGSSSWTAWIASAGSRMGTPVETCLFSQE